MSPAQGIGQEIGRQTGAWGATPGVAETVAPGVVRVLAGNPGPLTGAGTNTYLVEQADGLAAIDPGPELPEHLAAVLGAGGGRLRRILLTHHHADHSGAASRLAEASGAPVLAWRRPGGDGLRIDHALSDGEPIGDGACGLIAVHTPGHASDHVCFRAPGLSAPGPPAGGVLFSGDHVMGWSTSLVSPPDGDMADYLSSLRLLLGLPEALYLPGHGPTVASAHRLVRGLLAHRLSREQAILGALAGGPLDIPGLLTPLYGALEAALRPAAERVILAHLLKLERDGRVAPAPGGLAWQAVGALAR